VPTVRDYSAGDWDRIAEIISSDKPADLKPEWLEGHLAYVAEKGRAAAPILWDSLAPRSGSALLDIGAGLGAYSLAFLDCDSNNRATLFDLPEAIELYEQSQGAKHPRARTIAGDARVYSSKSEYDLVLLANVLHLFGPEECNAMLERAVAAAIPGGRVILKDVLISPDRSGPLVALYFALNMALYTESGDVHATSTLEKWMTSAGLRDVGSLEIPGLSSSAIVVGVRD
jgi:cyclopropane fatty-acyl-phospholipid synthase-like methyltransferase